MENQAQSLLQKYQSSGSDQAFTELVSQHVDLVYSVALRQVGEPDMAKEICQLVFIKLSEKAHTLDPKTILSGWLCRTARFICADHLKARYRREQREKEYAMQNHHTQSEDDIWEALSPRLDAALAELSAADQDILALRFFEKKQFARIGLDLGINDVAAKMRVGRALEKLRKILAGKGITLTLAALGTLMMANAVRAVSSEVRGQILSQLKSLTHSAHLARAHNSRLRSVRMLIPVSVLLLLTVIGVLIHSTLANRGAVALKGEAADKPSPGSIAETSMTDASSATGASSNANSIATASSQSTLIPYAPREFSEDTDDLKYILDYVAAQLPHIKLADGAGVLKPMQVGILGDPRYMTQEASFINGSSEVKRASNLNDLDDCSVIMIVVDDEEQIRAALTALADRPVITIGLHTNFLAWGGCINFVALDNVLNYGLNLDRAKTIGCSFSDILTNAAAELFENGKQVCRFAARPGDDTELDFFEKKNPFLPKGFTRRMKRLVLSDAKRNAIIDAWRQYPADETVTGNPHAMADAMQEQQRESKALQNSGSMSFEAMKNISDKFNAKAYEIFSNNMSASIEVKSRIRGTRAGRLGLLAPVLTPDELFGYRYLLDSEASQVANLMRVIDITPDELRRIAFVFDEHADPMINGNLSPATEAIFQQELGSARYAQYKAAYSPAGQELALVIVKYSNPLAHRTFLGTTRLTPKRSY